MVVYSGKTILKVGENVGTAVTISNIKRMQWRRVTDVKARTVMNTTIPVGWQQGHKWVEGELHVLSEAKTAFANYLKEDTDNVVVPYAVAECNDESGGKLTATFTGFILSGHEQPYVDGDDTVWVYRFLAYKVVET